MISSAVLTLSWAIALLVSFPLLYLSLEVCFGLVPSRRRTTSAGAMDRIAILIPAHDEEPVIEGTIRALRERIGRDSDILVVADNCSDETAHAARAAGANVVERHDEFLKGKGHALAFGRDYLQATNPPDIVIVLDADCQLDAGGDLVLARAVLSTGEVAQASNLLFSQANSPPLVQISNFAMLVKNLVRARGLERLGGGGLLFGTGMAFPWAIFSRAPLASSDVVEDMQLALWLARSGIKVHLEERARVTSGAAGVAESAGQRRRWEHGFLRTALRNALPLLAEGILRRSRSLMTLGLHLMVPPLALLLILASSALVALAGIAAQFGFWGPAAFLGASLLLASALLLVTWALEGRSALSGRALMAVPLYAMWKLPIYAGFIISRQKNWNRTPRPTDGDHAATETRH